jgi:hypothetical protein
MFRYGVKIKEKDPKHQGETAPRRECDGRYLSMMSGVGQGAGKTQATGTRNKPMSCGHRVPGHVMGIRH